MMPLTLASPGEENMIRKDGGSPEAKQHLADLGFVAGGNVTVVSAIGGVIAWIFKPPGWGTWQAAVASPSPDLNTAK